MADQWDPTKETYVDYLVSMHPQWNPAPAPAPAPPVGAAQPSGDVPPSLAGDPAYLAFTAALGMQRSNAERGTQNQIDAVNQSLPTRLAELSDAGDYSRQRISGGMESRGIFGSSEHELALARQRAAEGRQSSSIQTDATNRTNALRDALAGQLTGFDTQAVGERNASAQRQQQAADTAGINAQLAGFQPKVDDSYAQALAALHAPPAAAVAPAMTPTPTAAPKLKAVPKPAPKATITPVNTIQQDLIRRGLG